MNCQEFSNQVGEFVGGPQSQSALPDSLLEHAANCPRCDTRLETERSLTAGLQVLATDEQKIEAPSFLRSELLAAFENRAARVPSPVITFPTRANWARWAVAAAATLILGFVLFSARWTPNPSTNESARNDTPKVTVEPTVQPPSAGATASVSNEGDVPLITAPIKSKASSRVAKRTTGRIGPIETVNTATQVASSEVKSEFVPLTYLNNATAMESGIVVRVEIAREQLATLGLPFDLDRADEIIKADIVLGDDGVARAIRLVQ